MKKFMLAALLFCTSTAYAQAPRGNESAMASALEGVWSSRNDFGPALGGDFVVTRSDGVWRGAVAGAEGEAPSLDINFADQGGRFRGVLAADGRVIEGWWTQPPGLPGQAYVTPVRLAATGPNVWRGTIAPLPQTFTLHLSIGRDEEGRWVGAFRNPEFNLNGGSSRFFVNRSDATISFATAEGEVVREGMLADDGRRLRISWPPLPQPVELARASSADAPGYLPRAPGRYVYERPARANDGWRTARARDAGFDEAVLAGFIQRVIDADPAARRPQLIHSVLAARRGRLVLEEYFHGFDRDTPHDIRSAGKTFASALVGAAMSDGAQLAPDTPVFGLLARHGPFVNPDPRKANITLAHLMTHTSGLDCNDNDDNSRGNEGAMQGQSDQADWWRFALELPMAHDPGARYAYCTAGMNLVGAALRESTGRSVPELFDGLIARPLQFGRYHWNLAPDGEGYLGGGAYLRPRDLLKLGQLYLDGGVWNGHRVVSRAWVARSTSAHIAINEATTGMDTQTFANVATHGAEGYAWHLYGVRVGDRRVESYEANGNGGQFLIVVPAYDLVVVLTGGNYGQGGIWTRWRDEIVGRQIIAAITH